MSDASGDDGGVRALVRRAQAGDERAFDRLVRDVYDRVYRWALVRTGDADDADEVVQRVLVRVYRGLDGFEARSRLSTWLYRITMNAARDLDRKRASARRLEERVERDVVGPVGDRPVDAAGDAVAERMDRDRLTDVVRRFFECLPPRQRQIFDLVDLQGYEPAEAAEMLEMNRNTVRANLFKARRALRERTLKEHPELVEDYER